MTALKVDSVHLSEYELDESIEYKISNAIR